MATTQPYLATDFHAMLRKTSESIPGRTSVLIEMRLENYAVIDNLVVEFGPGLNLLTGETGAGKSILVDALALLLGEKASSDVIRAGAERAVVSAVFETRGRCGESAGEDSGRRTGWTNPTMAR